MYFCVVVCIVCFVSISVLFVFICVLNYFHRVATQLQLNISYHNIKMHGTTVKEDSCSCLLTIFETIELISKHV